MMHDQCRCRLLRHQLVLFGDGDSDPLWSQQLEQLYLMLQAGTRRVTETVARTAIMLAEQLFDLRMIALVDREFFPNLLVPELSQCFRRLDTQAMEVEILLIITGGEQLLAVFRCHSSHRHEMEGDNVEPFGIERRKKVGNAEETHLALPREGKTHPFREIGIAGDRPTGRKKAGIPQ